MSCMSIIGLHTHIYMYMYEHVTTFPSFHECIHGGWLHNWIYSAMHATCVLHSVYPHTCTYMHLHHVVLHSNQAVKPASQQNLFLVLQISNLTTLVYNSLTGMMIVLVHTYSRTHREAKREVNVPSCWTPSTVIRRLQLWVLHRAAYMLQGSNAEFTCGAMIIAFLSITDGGGVT